MKGEMEGEMQGRWNGPPKLTLQRDGSLPLQESPTHGCPAESCQSVSSPKGQQQLARAQRVKQRVKRAARAFDALWRTLSAACSVAPHPDVDPHVPTRGVPGCSALHASTFSGVRSSSSCRRCSAQRAAASAFVAVAAPKQNWKPRDTWDTIPSGQLKGRSGGGGEGGGSGGGSGGGGGRGGPGAAVQKHRMLMLLPAALSQALDPSSLSMGLWPGQLAC